MKRLTALYSTGALNKYPEVPTIALTPVDKDKKQILTAFKYFAAIGSAAIAVSIGSSAGHTHGTTTSAPPAGLVRKMLRSGRGRRIRLFRRVGSFRRILAPVGGLLECGCDRLGAGPEGGARLHRRAAPRERQRNRQSHAGKHRPRRATFGIGSDHAFPSRSRDRATAARIARPAQQGEPFEPDHLSRAARPFPLDPTRRRAPLQRWCRASRRREPVDRGRAAVTAHGSRVQYPRRSPM